MLKDEIKLIMRKNGLTFHKSLGQNFLICESTLENIVAGSGVTENDTVLEIGPGLGVLTNRLAPVAKKVTAIELDSKLATFLRANTPENVEIIQGDVLKIPLPESSIVIANIPYYITSPIIMRLLEENLPIRSATIMVQKEVAQRITAKPNSKNYGILSIACQYYSNPSILQIVPANCFLPAPKVDSAVVHMEILPEPAVNVNHESFFNLVRAAFSQRRKTLANSLSHTLNIEKNLVIKAIIDANLHENVRAENLSLEDFANLLTHLTFN
jgi:16S rRNA (adenine1518-N6/adenine1519-N6)-dimethyltransferase